jgi:hypothetical protein
VKKQGQILVEPEMKFILKSENLSTDKRDKVEGVSYELGLIECYTYWSKWPRISEEAIDVILVSVFLILHGLGILTENYENLTAVNLFGETASLLSQTVISGFGIFLGIAMVVSAIGLLFKKKFAIFPTMVISIYFIIYVIGGMIVLFLRHGSDVPVPIYLILGVFVVIYRLIFRTARIEWKKRRTIV